MIVDIGLLSLALDTTYHHGVKFAPLFSDSAIPLEGRGADPIPRHSPHQACLPVGYGKIPILEMNLGPALQCRRSNSIASALAAQRMPDRASSRDHALHHSHALPEPRTCHRPVLFVKLYPEPDAVTFQTVHRLIPAFDCVSAALCFSKGRYQPVRERSIPISYEKSMDIEYRQDS